MVEKKSKNIKVLMYSTYVPGGIDGTSNVSRHLIPALSEKGVDVTICTSDVNWYPEEIKAQRSPKVRIYKSWFNHNADLCFGMFLYFLKNIKKFDVVQFDGFYNFPTIFGSFCAQLHNVSYVICPRGAIVSDGWSIKRAFFQLFSKPILRKCKRIICTSISEKDRLRKHLPGGQYACVSDGVAIGDQDDVVKKNIISDELGIDPCRPIFLMLGRVAQEKGILFLLDVWKKINRERPEAVLVIAGTDYKGHRREVEAVVAGLSDPGSVIMPGPVTGDLKAALLRWSQCLLFPSRHESFGNVVLEALSYGTPVIASIGTPWKIMESESLGYWLPWEETLWTNVVLEILNNQDSYDSKCRDKRVSWVSKNYSWDLVADQYVHNYEDILRIRKERVV